MSNGLSAAQLLQQAHEAASVPASSHVDVEDPYPVHEDPFPVAPAAADAKPASRQPKQVDVSDESAFPTLGGGPGAAKKTGSLWGAGGSAAQRVRQHLAPPATGIASGASTPRSGASSTGDDAVSRPGFYSTTVQLAAGDIHVQSVGQPGRRQPGTFSNERTSEPTTVGEVLKLLNAKNPTVTAESSTSRAITTFIIKGRGAAAEADVAKVRRELLARLSKKVTIEVGVPAGLRPFIIGGKGKTLKDIQDATGANIQVPPRDPNADEAPTDALPDGPLIPVAISGEASAAQAAKAKILAIVAERAAKVQNPIPSVPKEFWPHINGPNGTRLAEILAAAGAEAATVTVPNFTLLRGVSASQAEEQPTKAADKVATVSGDRELVAKVIAAIEAEVAELRSSLKELAYGVNRAQHRFLVGPNAEAIFAETGCSVELPGPESIDDKVTIRGPQDQLVPALQLVIKHASGAPVESLDLSTAHRGDHDRNSYAANVTRYVLKQGKFKALAQENGAQVFLPKQASIAAGQPLIEITAPTAQQVAGARTAIIGIVRQLPPANFAVIEVDSLLHRHLNSAQNAKKLKAVQADQSVELLFPSERDSTNHTLLGVYTGTGSAELALDAVKTEVAVMVKQAAEIKTSTVSVPTALHKAIAGPNNTTLNVVIGEEKLVNVSFGDEQIVVRGPADHVARVTKELERLAVEAKDDQVASAHEIEFEIDAAQVRHIVGKAGAGINKLRDDLNVRVDFDDAKKAGGKAKVTIKGRKENALEAKKRIINAADRFADEVTLSIPLPATLERGALIGKQGTYLRRLEDKYEVKINFPKSRGEDAAGPAGKSEITVRGGKQGAEQAKGELVDLIAYERENGNTLNFAVSVKSLPRILGKAGVTINAIKDESNVQIDVDQAADEATTATITIRGTKGGIASAKTAIQAIAKEVDDEARLTLSIPREYHTTLIGSGGSAIRDIIARAGGPSDKSGQVVRFPRQGSADEDVLITAPKAIATKIKAALEEEVTKLQSRVVWGVAVPQSQHASVIGKGASALQELQRKHGVKVVMPGWNDYAQTGEIANKEDVASIAEGDVVKIVGPKEAAVAAAADLSKGRPSAPTVRETVQVPRKFHAKIAQGGRFFRSLPSGTRVTHDGQKPPSSAVKARKAPASINGSGASTPAARIDDDEAAAAEASSEIGFVLEALYEGAEGQDVGEIPWVVESTSQANADKVVAEITKQLGQADGASHVAWVTVPKGLMPRIVGRGGSGLDKLRGEGVEVEVVGKRDSNLLTLTGTPETIERAHQAIVQLAAPRERRQYRNDYEDDY